MNPGPQGPGPVGPGCLQAEIEADLIQAYTPMLQRVVRKFGREHLAEECMQEAMIGLLETYKEIRLDSPWFTGRAWVKARSRVRRLVWKISGPVAQTVGRTDISPATKGVEVAEFTDTRPDASALLSRAQLTRRVQERVAELKAFMTKIEAEAAALLLGPVQPPRWTEAAERLGVTTEALTVARRRAERLLRKGIPEELAVELIGTEE